MTHQQSQTQTMPTEYARYGLSLPQQALRALEKRGILLPAERLNRATSIWLGGMCSAASSPRAVADMGRYLRLSRCDGSPAPWLNRSIRSPATAAHAIVIAPELVRDRDAAHRPYL